MADLKPCPFCGSDRVIWLNDPEDVAEIKGIYCLNCKAKVQWNIETKKTDTFGKTRNQWLDRWNRRDSNG